MLAGRRKAHAVAMTLEDRRAEPRLDRVHAPAHGAMRDAELDRRGGKRARPRRRQHRGQRFERRKSDRAVHGMHISPCTGGVCQCTFAE